MANFAGSLQRTRPPSIADLDDERRRLKLENDLRALAGKIGPASPAMSALIEIPQDVAEFVGPQQPKDVDALRALAGKVTGADEAASSLAEEAIRGVQKLRNDNRQEHVEGKTSEEEYKAQIEEGTASLPAEFNLEADRAEFWGDKTEGSAGGDGGDGGDGEEAEAAQAQAEAKSEEGPQDPFLSLKGDLDRLYGQQTLMDSLGLLANLRTGAAPPQRIELPGSGQIEAEIGNVQAKREFEQFERPQIEAAQNTARMRIEAQQAQKAQERKDKLAQQARLSEGQAVALGDYDKTMAALDDIAKLSQEIDTGPLQNLIDKAADATGLIGAERAAYRGQIENVGAQYRKAMSGVAINPAEYKRFLQVMPNASDEPEVIRAKGKKMKEYLQLAKDRRLESLQAIGKDVSGFRTPKGQGKVKVIPKDHPNRETLERVARQKGIQVVVN